MNDEEIEKAVLYYIIFEKQQCDLTEQDFTKQIHKKIIKAINSLKMKKQEISILTIKNNIDEKSIETLTYLSDLGEYIFSTSIETSYELLKKYTKKRQMLELVKKVQGEIVNVEDIDTYAEKIITNLQKIEFQNEKEENFINQISNTLKNIEKKMNDKEDLSLYTGFFELDALTDGLHNGELTVIGARPRSGENNFCTANC